MKTRAEKEHEHTAIPYVVTYAVLLVLTVVTFSVARLDLGSWRIPVALLIAATKGFFVAYFFMHLREQRGVNAIFFIVAVIFIVILIGGMAADVQSRGATPLPPAGPGPVAPLE